MVLDLVGKAITKVFGSRNERQIKSYKRRVEQINTLESQISALTDAQLRGKTEEFRQRFAKGERMDALMPHIMATAREVMDRGVGIRNIFNPAAGFDASRLPSEARAAYERVKAQAETIAPIEVMGQIAPAPGWMQVEIPIELYRAVRQLYPESRPPFRARPFDVQLIGGMVLGEGKIAEMKTGEGKTIVAPLACYVACIEGLQCHVVTVNDYLVQRDRDWVFPFYFHLGLTVGAIHPFHMQTQEDKQAAYHCNTVYGTNSEFGFDYLRDNMKHSAAEQVQKTRDFVVIDEVDSILIDEARTPLIISGPAHDDKPRYDLADKIARHLIAKQRDWDAADAVLQQAVMRAKGLEGEIRNTRDKDKIPAWRDEMKELQGKIPQLQAARDRYTQFYEVEREKKATHLTHDGVTEAQKQAGIGSFYVGANMDFPHLLENSLRSHVVYQADKDYVVYTAQGETEASIVIVDESTGRLMIGRQWSDGLHQAVEAKEKVRIKEETQTMATVTIQNFFKLYKRRAGMTGTAQTEATEFQDIYGLDVVAIPTNLPGKRSDRNDLIFIQEKDKWEAILDEIKRVHDIGRPVLVGTTSVDRNVKLAQGLSRKHGIKHEVLNAKQHEREAHVIAHAGELGAVMIATNMAGRGTDIKLSPIDRAALVRHWQQRNTLSRDATAEMTDEEIIKLAYRHQATVELGMKPKDAAELGADECKLRLMRHWVKRHTFVDHAKADAFSGEQCVAELDAVPDFLAHRLQVFKHVEEMGGLHIIGTERHEARRIDNQLRGRAGRQGDRGSSRFFVALDDDLMKMFANKTTLAALSKLGMKEGDAIEHPWLTKSVARAQRKVEERNYEIRKNLLEYDEVMEHQRNAFYGIRQDVIEGRNVDRIIFGYIDEAVTDAVAHYTDRDYVPSQTSEWCRQTLDVNIEAHKLRYDNLHDLQRFVGKEAEDDVVHTVDVTLGEYMSNDVPPEEWDIRGMADWAQTKFGVALDRTKVREMSIDEVKRLITDAALALISKKDLSGLAKFLDPLYAAKDLAEWTRQKFEISLNADDLVSQRGESLESARTRIGTLVVDKAQEAYRQREMLYPIEFIIQVVFDLARTDGPAAATELANWANQRFEMGWTPESITKMTGQEIQDQLGAAAKQWLDGPKSQELVDRAIRENSDDPQRLVSWARQRLLRTVTPADLANPQTRRQVMLDHVRGMLRTELTQLERYVLLQILDSAWKDHLYAMDQLKDSVSLQSYAERDPRIVYKREGSMLFVAMQRHVRDRVTELIFRARLGSTEVMRNVYAEQRAEQPVAPTALTAAPAAEPTASGGGASAEPDIHQSRKARRAAAAAGDEDASDDNRPQFKERKKKRR